MEAVKNVGFIGLGHAGWPMAENVAAGGFTVVAGDADRERELRFVSEHPGAVAASVAGYRGVQALITMLPNGQVVREVVLDGGVADELEPGAVVVDMSSSDPAGTVELGAELAERGLVLVDAPVSMPALGGAWSRSLTLMVGGDDNGAIERVMPVLEAMSENIFRVGGLGTGHVAKTLNNYVSAAGLLAALDAIVMGARAGIDPATLLDVFNVSTGRNFSTAFALKEEALPRRYGSGFSIGLLVKDMGIVARLAERLEVDAPLTAFLRDRFGDALDELGFDADHTEALVVWEQKAQVQLPTSVA